MQLENRLARVRSPEPPYRALPPPITEQASRLNSGRTGIRAVLFAPVGLAY